MVALNGVLGASSLGSSRTGDCGRYCDSGELRGTLGKNMLATLPITSGAERHMSSWNRTMLETRSPMGLGTLGAAGGAGSGGLTCRGTGVTSYMVLVITMPAPPSTAAW